MMRMPGTGDSASTIQHNTHTPPQGPGRAAVWQNLTADQPMRQQFTAHILRLFQTRQHHGMQEGWTEKMPDFVRRLEDALYRSARTKEEYSNLQTLEPRLQQVAQRMVNRRGHAMRPQMQQAQAAAQDPGTGSAQTSIGQNAVNPNGLSPTLGNASSATSEQGSFGHGLQGQAQAAPQNGVQQSQKPNPGANQPQGPAQSNLPNFPAQQGLNSSLGGPGSQTNPNLQNGYHNMANTAHPSLSNSNSVPNGVKHEPSSLPTMTGQGLDNMQGGQQASRINMVPNQQMMRNGAPVMRGNPMREAWQNSNSPMLNGVSNLQQGNNGTRITINGPIGGDMHGSRMGGVQGIQQSPYDMSPSTSLNVRQMHMQRSPTANLRGMGSGNSMQQGAMPSNNMMPISNSSMMPPLNGNMPSNMMPPLNGNISSSPMGGMHNPLMRMQHLNPMQGAGHRRPGSAGMVPVSAASLAGNVMNNMSDLNGNISAENNIIRPNSAAANENSIGPLPNGMIADPGLPNPNMGLPNGNLNGSSINRPLSSAGLGSQMGPNGLGNSPMISQNFPNSGISALHMGSMPMASGSMGSMPMGSMGLSGVSQMAPAQDTEEVDQVLSGGGNNKEYIAKQQRWLLFLRHCAKCEAEPGQCTYGQSCVVAKALWKHIMECSSPECHYPRCVSSRNLLKHHQKCISTTCPICTPVKQYVQKQRLIASQTAMQHRHAMHQQMGGHNPMGPDFNSHHQGMGMSMGMNEMSGMTMQQMQYARQQQIMQQRAAQQQQGYPGMVYQHPNNMMYQHAPAGLPMRRSAQDMQGGIGMHPDQPPAKRYRRVVDQNNTGTSLLEALPAQDIEVHLQMLRTTANAIKASCDSKGVFCHHGLEDEGNCGACGLRKYVFEPLPLFCATCFQKIKRNQMYWKTPPDAEVKGTWCVSCYAEDKKNELRVEGFRVLKEHLKRAKNDEESEEAWVQCDQCQRWVHQICGLFNKGRNSESTMYVCPDCLLRGLEVKIRQPIGVRPQSMLEAKDLARTPLSDKMEEHLRATIQEDRMIRAEMDKKLLEDVLVPEGLTIRVINNISKKAEVKHHFYHLFAKEGYPDAFPYDQKVVLLFQKIDGVDVLLYCFYVQEYGDKSVNPNKRWVYLSYLDSVKYFQPELPSHRGTALRTMVYQDILESYIGHIKEMGYTSMFIWACPPFQGDDYILHCHPMRQKVPKNGMLREWYLTITRACQKQGIVTHTSNLWDSFFAGGNDHKTNASVLNMPYLEGDYWPGEVETQLNHLQEEERKAAKKNSKKGLAGGSRPGKKAKRCGPHTNMDEYLMNKLGEGLHGMKEDFIVVHLQEACSYCRKYMCNTEEGSLDRWYHPNPPTKIVYKNERSFEGINLDNPGANTKQSTASNKFQLCDTCYQQEKSGVQGQARGLPQGIKLEDLIFESGVSIPNTKDTQNPEMHNEFFDTRQSFLSLCQGNHYQFDTIRRAKHSSMMVLYHLHNPEAPAFVSTCNNCQAEIEPGEGYRCTVCQDYDLCRICREEKGVQHDHPLKKNVRGVNETQVRLTAEQQKDRAAQIKRTMHLLRHASECKNPECASSNCRKVKNLFVHAKTCQARMGGGCQYCRRLMALLQIHAKQCTDQMCTVPRCRELRELRRRKGAKQEAHRRIHFQAMNMARQNE